MELSDGNRWVSISDPDSMNDFLSHVNDLKDFLTQLGNQWVTVRNDYFEKLPKEMVMMLDSLHTDNNFMVCCAKDCLKPVYGTWDFCKEHGDKT